MPFLIIEAGPASNMLHAPGALLPGTKGASSSSRPYYWSLLRAGEPLYRSCHVRLEVKEPVKATQLEDLTDWGLQGRQGNIAAVATGKLVVADQR
jgi:hypothetical protein